MYRHGSLWKKALYDCVREISLHDTVLFRSLYAAFRFFGVLSDDKIVMMARQALNYIYLDYSIGIHNIFVL